MDVKELLERQKEEALLKAGGAWLLVAESLLARVEELEVRMAMYESCAPEEEEGVSPLVAQALEDAEKDRMGETWAEEEKKQVPELKYGDSMDVSDRLRLLIESGEAEKLRKRSGISASEVARHLGVSSSGVRGWETGKWRPGEQHAIPYLNLLWNLQHGNTPEGYATHEHAKHEDLPELNGLQCVFCGNELRGKQKRFDTQSCARAYSYLQKKNPDATKEQLMTLVAGIGQRGKRRSFPTLEEMEQAAEREPAEVSG